MKERFVIIALLTQQVSPKEINKIRIKTKIKEKSNGGALILRQQQHLPFLRINKQNQRTLKLRQIQMRRSLTKTTNLTNIQPLDRVYLHPEQMNNCNYSHNTSIPPPY